MTVELSPLKPLKNDAYGFNVFVDLGEDRSFQVNGLRVWKSGLIYGPSVMYGRGKFYPSVLLPREVAEEIYRQLSEKLKLSTNVEEVIARLIWTEKSKADYINALSVPPKAPPTTGDKVEVRPEVRPKVRPKILASCPRCKASTNHYWSVEHSDAQNTCYECGACQQLVFINVTTEGGAGRSSR